MGRFVWNYTVIEIDDTEINSSATSRLIWWTYLFALIGI